MILDLLFSFGRLTQLLRLSLGSTAVRPRDLEIGQSFQLDERELNIKSTLYSLKL